MEGAAGISLENATEYDADFNGYADGALEALMAGEAADVDAAIALIKKNVSTNFDYITVE